MNQWRPTNFLYAAALGLGLHIVRMPINWLRIQTGLLMQPKHLEVGPHEWCAAAPTAARPKGAIQFDPDIRAFDQHTRSNTD